MATLPEEKLETILVVDDVDAVLQLTVRILDGANFNVLQADSGETALKLASEHPGTIDLLLSDVKMPGMSGPDLGEALKKSRPDMHVILMSGYAGGDTLALNFGWAFIEKPFVPTKLVEMINVILHMPDRSQGALCANMTETPCMTVISEQGGKETQHGNDERFCPPCDAIGGDIRFGIG